MRANEDSQGSSNGALNNLDSIGYAVVPEIKAAVVSPPFSNSGGKLNDRGMMGSFYSPNPQPPHSLAAAPIVDQWAVAY